MDPHDTPLETEKPRKRYWTSLAQYNDDPEFVERSHKEFPASPLQEADHGPDFEVGRRGFMKLMAASTALASSACFQRPMHKILPYVNQPEEVTFGVPNWYASTCGECAARCGTLVKTREGRPIKVEGNPDHPLSQGGLCARGQASILNLYDPDRLRNAVTMIRGSDSSALISWADVDHKIGDKLRNLKAGPGKVRLLTGTVNSPATRKLIEQFIKNFPNSKHVEYDALGTDHVAMGQELAYGTRLVPHYRVDKADLIVTIDADFLGTWMSPVEFTKKFTHGRKLKKSKNSMNRLVTFESAVTLTGSNADTRVAIRPEDGAAIALALAQHLVETKHATVDKETAEVLGGFTPSSVSSKTGVAAKTLTGVADNLWENRGKSLVLAGSPQSQTENGVALQLAVNLLNSILQNDGVTVDYENSTMMGQGSYADLQKLVKDMDDSEVDALFIYGLNPAYALPKSVGFSEASKKVALVVSFNDRVDETANLADYVLPDNHPLESWGDAQPQKHVYSLQQPTIRPVYDTRSFQDSLLAFAKVGGIDSALAGVKDFHEYLQNHWRETVYKESGSSAPFNLFWESSLRDGVVSSVSNASSKPRSFKGTALKNHVPKSSGGDYSLAFYTQVAMGDGSTANNGWLQELPDPISRICWDNYVSVSPQTAESLHLVDGDKVKVTAGETTFELPALVQPGQHDKVLAVALGFGREAAGNVGSHVGQNAFKWMNVKDGFPVFSGFPATVAKTGAKYILANIQEQHTMAGREPVREAFLEEYIKNPAAGNEANAEETAELTTIWNDYKYEGYRWHMAIDLNSCTGCSACVVSCHSENNVPVVGKDGVYRGRIMHWIRIDRYYSGTPDSPRVYHQPMLCQHCENAPCETVCPVIATSHDNEGLNIQTYNRCVGTRYCANNCPYKVRRFNWFDYNYGGQIRYPQTLSQNPEVTVRSRGVMEKCSFCVQRISDAKNKARDLVRPVKDQDLQTACQQSCPADAISFGNINDAESTVADLAKNPRGFHVLEELNVRPSITYLTKIRNAEQNS